jgi:hypothetical protein
MENVREREDIQLHTDELLIQKHNAKPQFELTKIKTYTMKILLQ